MSGEGCAKWICHRGRYEAVWRCLPGPAMTDHIPGKFMKILGCQAHLGFALGIVDLMFISVILIEHFELLTQH